MGCCCFCCCYTNMLLLLLLLHQHAHLDESDGVVDFLKIPHAGDGVAQLGASKLEACLHTKRRELFMSATRCCRENGMLLIVSRVTISILAARHCRSVCMKNEYVYSAIRHTLCRCSTGNIRARELPGMQQEMKNAPRN